jgi:hypothetical protein
MKLLLLGFNSYFIFCFYLFRGIYIYKYKDEMETKRNETKWNRITIKKKKEKFSLQQHIDR